MVALAQQAKDCETYEASENVSAPFNASFNSSFNAAFNAYFNASFSASRSAAKVPSCQARLITVSNAPPILVEKDGSGNYKLKPGSGGLIACVEPVLCKNANNVWLANFGSNKTEAPLSRRTNAIGPLMKLENQRIPVELTAEHEESDFAHSYGKKARETTLLLDALADYNGGGYRLQPVLVDEGDFSQYYTGISNNLLWPALHGLDEYIPDVYRDEKTLHQHWSSYIRVNYQFAMELAKISRPRDVIWVHDYHLFLVGQQLQSMDARIEVVFFLHIPFHPSADFFKEFELAGISVLRGLLAFSKVGFQTHEDRERFVEEVKKNVKEAKLEYDGDFDVYTASMAGRSTTIGVFPVSIPTADFLQHSPETAEMAQAIRRKALGDNASADARLFFSAERFDYTKGIREKLLGFCRYLIKHPERQGKDVLYQVASCCRKFRLSKMVCESSGSDYYAAYQDECLAIAAAINAQFQTENWKPIILETNGRTRRELIACYSAMDVGVVTPRQDGLNLVAKEMAVVNPAARLILSTGAGAERQFHRAGLFEDSETGRHNYTRVENVQDIESIAVAFFQAANEDEKTQLQGGSAMKAFIIANDTERWGEAFLEA